MTRIRRTTIILLLACATIGAGTLSIQASPTCERIVHEVRERVVRNRVSQATLARWQAWGKTHPDFKPPPRPRYKLTPEEVTRKIEVACDVPLINVTTDGELPPIVPDFEFPPTQFFMPPAPLPNVVEVPTVAASPAPSYFPPYTPVGALPPTSGEVPEPSSWILALTGLLLLCLERRWFPGAPRRSTQQ
jgi:hypothetical protein